VVLVELVGVYILVTYVLECVTVFIGVWEILMYCIN